jgi:hypothetical protein
MNEITGAHPKLFIFMTRQSIKKLQDLGITSIQEKKKNKIKTISN